MSNFDKTDFVQISFRDLVERCEKLAERCIESGDILPPKSWFDDNESSDSRFYWFDKQLRKQRDKFFLRLWKMIDDEEPWSPTLPNEFALRCMALFACRHLRLAFLNVYNTTEIKLTSASADHAFFWALTSFWR